MCGHIHVQFRREGPRGIELVNPGSVGAPWDGDRRAAWALAGETVELRRVEYDWQGAADAIRERLGEAGELPASASSRPASPWGNVRIDAASGPFLFP